MSTLDFTYIILGDILIFGSPNVLISNLLNFLVLQYYVLILLDIYYLSNFLPILRAAKSTTDFTEPSTDIFMYEKI